MATEDDWTTTYLIGRDRSISLLDCVPFEVTYCFSRRHEFEDHVIIDYGTVVDEYWSGILWCVDVESTSLYEN